MIRASRNVSVIGASAGAALGALTAPLLGLRDAASLRQAAAAAVGPGA
ncbi:hypothetical protein [Micromonospora sp. NPDC047074]